MSCINFSEKLLGLQDVNITNVEEFNEKLHVYISQKSSSDHCPQCGSLCNKVHDYREQKVKDLPICGKELTLIFKKRRLHCDQCNKHFYQKSSFLPKYHRMTKRFTEHILKLLIEVRSFSSVARDFNLSVTTVIRFFDALSYGKPTSLPRCIAFDEFKGSTGKEKYQCIITDPETHRVLDILPKRTSFTLNRYLRSFPKEERNHVELFVSDMWKPFQESASFYFPNATRIIDKYHWVRQMTWAFENVRKSEQRKFGKQYRIYFKHSRKLLLKHFDTLDEDTKRQVLIMLDTSVPLSRSHFYKEELQKILKTNEVFEKKEKFKRWIDYTENCGIIQFEKCTDTYRHWLTEILASMDTDITNGFTEGCNNKIKVLKRNAYGYRNFRRFRNRILHIFSNQRTTA